jgi:hypothetical protein
MVCRRNVRDHHGAAVAREGVLEQPRQLGVPVVDVFALALGERVDAVAERKQGAVDVGTLLQAFAAVLN